MPSLMPIGNHRIEVTMIDWDAVIYNATADAVDLYMLETFTVTVDMLASLWAKVDSETIEES